MKEISFEIPDRDERGVSPVIGVILMVAVTVILAAVIASFVLGFGDSVESNPQAGVSYDDGTVTVISLGANSVGVYCSAISEPSDFSTDTDSDQFANEVGDTFSCGSGENVVAVHDNGNSAVVKDLDA